MKVAKRDGALVRPRLRFDVSGVIVFFVLLTIVMVAAPMEPHNSMGLDIPRVAHSKYRPGALREDAIVITVMPDGKIFFGRDQIPLQDVAPAVEKAIAKGSPSTIDIRDDARVRYRTINLLVDSLSSIGIRHVVFIVQTPR